MLNRPRYRPLVWNLFPGVLVFLLVVGTIALIWDALNRGPWLFMLLWLAILVSIGFEVYRTNYQLEFDDAYLYWKGFLQSGRVLTTEIVAVRADSMGAVAVFHCRNGEKVRVMILQGFAPFLIALKQAHPSIEATPGFYARLVERAQLRRKP
jgi:hypothetical protein